MLQPYHKNLENDTENNKLFRKVVYTVPRKFQLVLMSLNVGEIIPFEIHKKTVQFIRIESGTGVARIGTSKTNYKTYKLAAGSAVTVPNNRWHEIRNTSKTQPLKLYTIYTPPAHGPHDKDVRQPKSTH